MFSDLTEGVLGEFASAHYLGKGPKTLDEVGFLAWQDKRLKDRLSHQKRLLWQPGYWEAYKARTRRSVATWKAKPGNREKQLAWMKVYYQRPEVKEANKLRCRQRLLDPVRRKALLEYKKKWRAKRLLSQKP